MSQTDFSVSSINTWCYGLNSLRYLASKAWNIVPLELKNLTNVEMLKWEIVDNIKIIKWKSRQCECKACLPYVYNIDHVTLNDN